VDHCNHSPALSVQWPVT